MLIAREIGNTLFYKNWLNILKVIYRETSSQLMYWTSKVQIIQCMGEETNLLFLIITWSKSWPSIILRTAYRKYVELNQFPRSNFLQTIKITKMDPIGGLNASFARNCLHNQSLNSLIQSTSPFSHLCNSTVEK